MGFVVGAPGAQVESKVTDVDVVTVYVPTAPNPTSGYVLMVPSRGIERNRHQRRRRAQVPRVARRGHAERAL